VPFTNTLVAGTRNEILPYQYGGEILLSTDSGESWIKAHEMLGDVNYIRDITFLDRYLGFAIARNHGTFPNLTIVLRTQDGGFSWNEVLSSPNGLDGVHRINDKRIWISGSDNFVSSDSGTTWIEQNYSNVNGVYYATFVDSKVGFGFSGTQIVKTSDGGNTWSVIPFNFNFDSFRSLHFLDSTCGFVGLIRDEYRNDWWSDIYKTNDGGITWDRVFTDLWNVFSSFYFVNDSIGFAYSNSGGSAVRTTNMGESWSRCHYEISWPEDFLYQDSTLYAAGRQGRFAKSFDFGESWSNIAGAGYLLGDIQFTNEKHGYISASFGKLGKSVDGGENWVFFEVEHSFREICFLNDSLGFALEPTNPEYNAISSKELYKTEDGGKNWDLLSVQAEDVSRVKMLDLFFLDENTGYIVGEYNLILKTSDGGLTWKLMFSSNDYFLHFQSILFLNESVGYALAGGDWSKGIVFKTIDGGENWMDVYESEDPDQRLQSFHFCDQDVGYVVGNEGIILSTYDGGNTWVVQHSNSLSDLTSVLVLDQKNTIIAGEKGTLMATDDGGKSWHQLDIGLDLEIDFSNICLNNKKDVFVIGNHGAIIKNGSPILSSVESPVISGDFASNSPILYPSYPNPFNLSSTIKYDLQKSSDVVLKIYSIAGQELETLVNGFQVSGMHDITWQPKGLASGIYLYRLQSDEFSGTMKLVLQK
jgi:photosystem II stability/assembly factor-like uncharacterized protein